MARINVPPPSGNINLTVGDELTIHAAQACNFCCTIGSNFSPDLTDVALSQGDNGPYTAETAGSGQYNTSDSGSACNPNAPNPRAIAKSVQINPPTPRPKPK
jgi:hypothetical protein